jgi:hypothetical protein
MNSKKTLVLVGTAVLCGLALAQTPPQRTPTERLEALEKDVVELRVRLDAQAANAGEILALKKELFETRAIVDQLTQWTATQAEDALVLSRVLDEVQEKGFTAGINPDSRILLLGGLRGFLLGMRRELPKVIAPPAPPPPAEKQPARDER